MKIQLDEWQEEVLRTEGNIVLCSGRQTGKSLVVSYLAGYFVANNKDKAVLIISATERQAEELFIKCLIFLDDHYKSLIKKGKDRPTKHVIKLTNGSIIRCLPVGLSGISVRGYTTDLLIADEAAFIPSAVFPAVTPQLLTRGGRIVLVSTPHGRDGYFFECYHDDDFTTFHVNSVDIIKERPISPSWTEWQREKAIHHLDKEKERMTKLEWEQEYLGMFVADLRQFFEDSLIQKCQGTKRPKVVAQGSQHYLGVDIARLGSDETALELVNRIGDRLIHIENIITTKTHINETVDLIVATDKQYKFKHIYIDDGGVGAGVFDYLLTVPSIKRRVTAINNAQRSLDNIDKKRKKLIKEDLYNNLLRMMEQGKIVLLDDPEVFASLKSIQYEYTDAGQLKIHGKYSHICEGLIRAAWCVKDKSLNIWAR